MMLNARHSNFYSFSVALFLYATLIVDLYRKIGGVLAVDTVRNVLYIISFGFILIDMIKTKRLIKMLGLFIVVSVFFLISSFINSGHNTIYASIWILFVSRLFPAYYIGRYTENWDEVSKYVSNLSWLALVYSFLAILSPNDGMSNSYATIATNLVFVSFITFRYAKNNKQYIKLGISIICFISVLFLGTRAVFVGTLLSIGLVFLLYINKTRKKKRIILLILTILGSTILVIFLSDIIRIMGELLPNSRTIRMLSEGDMLDDSNRMSAFYSDLFYSLGTNPFKIYGFIGDRIYLAGQGATNEIIISSFSHNVLLEICMNFGLIPGVIINIYFLIILLKGLINSKYSDIVVHYVFLSFLGVTFVEMMLSSSYLGSYYIWLLYGLAFRFVKLKTRLHYVA